MSLVLLKWILFNLFVIGMLALDLGVFHRKAHVVKMKEALLWSAFWIALALLYNGFVYYWRGPQAALEFLTGYLIEKSLSVDNIFVFVLIFSYFKVPAEYQHRVLFWGIIGALVMRGILIAVGAALIANFAWVIYVFGAFLIYTGFKMAVSKEHGVDPRHNPVVNWFRRIIPVENDYHGQRFLIRRDGRAAATPLLLVLVSVEFTDLIFAVDSIPAIFAVTRDPFIVYTSNVFAILGLRSLYFALAGVVHKFRFLKLGLGLVLCFVGVKMLLAHSPWKISTPLALGVVGMIIAGSIVFSLVIPEKEEKKAV